MRRLLTVLTLLAMPSLAFAQTPQPADKEAILLQLIDDMKQGRATIHPSEVDAAGCKVQLRAVQTELESVKKAAEKKQKPDAEKPE